MAFTNQSGVFIYKLLLTFQLMDQMAENDLMMIQKDGSVALTTNWDAGSFNIKSLTFESDVATGTAPFTVASTTLVTNLNADYVNGVRFTGFGSWTTQTVGTIYQASTDGFVVFYVAANVGVGTTSQYFGNSDSSTPPTVSRAFCEVKKGTIDAGSMMFPVKKNDYWKVYLNAGSAGSLTALYWVSLGA